MTKPLKVKVKVGWRRVGGGFICPVCGDTEWTGGFGLNLTVGCTTTEHDLEICNSCGEILYGNIGDTTESA
jgi:predicted RNA-binding Zn-ribbon protein involved in translation (DUF1610 family)